MKPKGNGKLGRYFLISLLITAILSFAMAYWPHLYKDLKLIALGADLKALTDVEAISTVNPESQAEAYRLYHSLMGVGWPVSAVAWFLFYFIPYMLVCWAVLACYKWLANIKGT